MKTKADTVKKQSTDLFTAASKLDLPAIDTDLIISQAKSFLLVIERMTPTVSHYYYCLQITNFHFINNSEHE